MKWLFISWVVLIVSCGNHPSPALSADQQGLFKLSQNFKTEYKDTSDSRDRERLIAEYELKLQDYLKHRCSYTLENIRVKLKKFEEDGRGRVYAQFVDGNNEYYFQKQYKGSSEMRADTAYQLVKSIQPGRDITVRFLFAGNVKVSEPGTASANAFHIEVIPTSCRI